MQNEKERKETGNFAMLRILLPIEDREFVVYLEEIKDVDPRFLRVKDFYTGHKYPIRGDKCKIQRCTQDEYLNERMDESYEGITKDYWSKCWAKYIVLEIIQGEN